MENEVNESRIPIKIWAKNLEDNAYNQILNLAKVPLVSHHIAIMADAHAGKGSTIGSVFAMEGGIIPAAVGVDIGCGMMAVKLPFSIDTITSGGNKNYDKGEALKQLRHSFERSIPLGRDGNHTVSSELEERFKSLGQLRIFKGENKETRRSMHQLGSLGGGNHFIEVCFEREDNSAWIMIHTGSRHIGLVIANKYIEKAQKTKAFDVPDPFLHCLLEGTEDFDNYIHDFNWALNYARINRIEILQRLLKDVSFFVYGDKRLLSEYKSGKLFSINCHHNYALKENHFEKDLWVIRKGAISARKNEWGIIPGSMGAKSFIVKGLGNPESFFSSSHGAGRKMSRGMAFKTFQIEDIEQQTAGVECRKDRSIIDEIPSAYKDIDEVMECQKDLVEPVYTLKQILCVKGGKD